MSRPDPTDPRTAAVHAILRLAEEDRRRGLQYWFDPALADSLRDLVREAGSPNVEVRTSVPPDFRRVAREGDAERGATPEASAAVVVGRRAPGVFDGSARAPGAFDASSRAPVRPASVPASSSAAGVEAHAASGKRPAWGPPPQAEGRFEDWAARLQAVGEEAAGCTACGLARTRQHVVFGTGAARVPLVFVGEAPGADEDAQGIPFVGRAGQLLTKIIEAIGLKREEVYICNVLKCRPPENRNPAPDEIEKCSHFLDRQLELLRPKVVCTLGLFATQTLLETTVPIGKLRGRLIMHRGLRVVPTYHPAALLRNPSYKATVWEDVQLLRRILDE